MDITVGRWTRSSGRISSAPYPRATATRAPDESAAKVRMNDPMCDIDDPGRKTSAVVSSTAAAALAKIQPRLSPVWTTPLAGPVLPEVKKIAAGAAGSGGAGTSAGGVAATSSNRGPSPAPSYQTVPRGRSPARPLAAMSPARSAWTTSADAPLTSRAWSISRAV